MPHTRNRHAIQQVLKKLKFFRVISLQGARQTGKSFLARELLPSILSSYKYETLDQRQTRQFIEKNPESFLEKHGDFKTLAMDEAQKAPDLFEAVKLKVDVNTRPGQYILLGSTEFSREVRVKEALTGRLGRVRIFPFNFAETQSLPPNLTKNACLIQKVPRAERKMFLRYLDHGGFPGIFHIREPEARSELMNGWLKLVIERDLLQFIHLRMEIDTELCDEILIRAATSGEPTIAWFSKELGVSARKIQKHIKLLEQLFVLHKLMPHSLGSGKQRYLLCDPGLATHLGASFHRQLETALWLEQLSQHSYRGGVEYRLRYYRGTRGGIIDLVVEDKARQVWALKIISEEGYDQRDFEILRAFETKAKASGLKVQGLYALAPTREATTLNCVQVFPWESIL